jgi:hypothetical protein
MTKGANVAQVNVDPGSGDSGGSGVNALAAVAIVILVLLAFVAVYLLFIRDTGGNGIDVNIDASPGAYLYHALTA